MANQICFHCFKKKGDRNVCPYCGYKKDTKRQQAYQLIPGTILHKRYIIGVSIGIGGFGITYSAYDTKLHFKVAVKEFYPAGLVNRAGGERKVGVYSGTKEKEFKRQHDRFLEEARNMALFSKDKDIVNVYDFFEENDTAYIIMEHVDAPLLKDRLKKGRISEEEACGYMQALLQALDKVHRQGIIHKDISSDNIFLTGADSIKLFDFGAAKFQGTETERTISIVEKSGYTPPEQYSSESEQGVYMDIYAAGAVFYEMVTGKKPTDALDRIVEDDLKRTGSFPIKIDEYLERIILKAMALDPKMRFQSAKQMQMVLCNHKKVELLEDMVKKHEKKKRLLSVLMLLAVFLIGGILLLSQTVFSGRGKIDRAAIQPEVLTVWLAAEKEEGEKLTQALLQSVQKVCPQLTVEVEVIKEEIYAEKLSQAAAKDMLPDIFCTDSMMELHDSNTGFIGNYCAELSELLNTMDLSSYIYLDQLKKTGDVYALPMALQVGIVYVNTEKEKSPPQYIEIAALLEKDTELGYADAIDIFTDFQSQDSDISWIVGDLSNKEQIEAVTLETVPSIDFLALPVLKEEKLTGCLKHWYSVKKSGNRNKEKAGMVLISVLLSDGFQSEAYMENGEGIPVNQTVLNSYRENKMTTYLSFIKEYDLNDMQLFKNTDVCSGIREEAGGYGK